MSYFENAKIGDEVCSFELGNNCKIVAASASTMTIRNPEGIERLYMTNAKLHGCECSAMQTAFYGSKLPSFELPPEPVRVPDWPVDTKVWVWDDDCLQTKIAAHLKEFGSDGSIRCYRGGQTSFTATQGLGDRWQHYELAEEEQ